MPKLTAKQLTICIVLIAVLLRLPEFMITLAYDEAWTLINFAPLPVKQLFFDLALPNNHPLNSVLIKLIAEFTLPVDFIRLPSMLAGIGAILLAGAIVKKLWSDTAAYWCMFFMAVNAPLAVYSAQARGYMLQIFFLLLYTYCVINSYYRQKNSRNPLPADCGVILCALASVTVLPTSSLYLAGITVILWNGINFKKIPRRLLITLTVAALLSATYLLINFNDLQTARHWGTSISSSTGFLSWMWENTVMLVPLFLLPLMIVSLYRERQYLIGIAAYFLIIFGSGILTNGGSARVYLPCCVMFCLLAAGGAVYLQERLPSKYRLYLFAVCIILAAANAAYQLPRWRFTNYYPLLTELKSLPAETLTICPAGDSYPILQNSHGKAAEVYAGQLECRAPERQLMLLNCNGNINGMDNTLSEKELPIPLKMHSTEFANLPTLVCQLQQQTTMPDAGTAIIAIQHPSTDELYTGYQQKLHSLSAGGNKILMLNCWFTGAELSKGVFLRGAAWYIAPGILSNAENWQIAEKMIPFVTFYAMQEQ